MTSFWDSSWEKIDAERLLRYINEFDMAADGIIEELLSRHVHTVCDAGCGCGIYALKLCSHGFAVSGFDVSEHAVGVARKLLENALASAKLKAASILATGYEENGFDAVVSRDVVDHMCKNDGQTAIHELYRIVRPGGIVFITLDHLDDEYETEPHIVNEDGDYVFTDGKWNGMVFHPYSEWELLPMVPAEAICEIADLAEGMIVKLTKPEAQ